jgi:AmiR/NasT family two-component response regulator
VRFLRSYAGTVWADSTQCEGCWGGLSDGKAMTSALILTDDSLDAATLVTDLEHCGFPVLGACTCHTLVRHATQSAPDVVVGWSERPSAQMFEALAILSKVNPCPVVLFTRHYDVQWVAQGIAAGVDGYVIDGYSASRLRAVIHVALERFRASQALRTELADLRNRYDERRLVDRAKGILMRSGAVTEDEAFRTLRSVSQRGNRRVGEVASRLIDAARAAEAVNRAGQLRMLSQRIVKLQALRAARVEDMSALALLAQSRARVLINLETLEKLLSKGTHGDLLARVGESWRAVEQSLDGSARANGLTELDACAEQLSVSADRLVSALGGSDPTSGLHAVNLCGRQRMLSQRLAKHALLSGLLDPSNAAAAREEAEATALEFERALNVLAGAAQVPAVIRSRIEAATVAWNTMRAAVAQAATREGRLELAASSEAVLDSFEQLTDQLEGSLHVLLWPSTTR